MMVQHAQVKWKDFATDLNLVPAAFNAERVGADGALPLVLRVARAVVPTTEVCVLQSCGISHGAYGGPVSCSSTCPGILIVCINPKHHTDLIVLGPTVWGGVRE